MKKSKKKLIIIIVLIPVLLLIVIKAVSCAISVTNPNGITASSGILVEPLSEHDLSTSISTSGTIESQNKLSVTSELTCKIEQLNVEVGDYVNVGDVLCVFDASELDAKIKSLEEQLSSSNSLSKKQAEINERALKNAKEEQTEQLAQANKAIETAQTNYNNAVSAKTSLEEAYKNCQNQLAKVQASIEQLQGDTQSDTYLELTGKASDLTVSSNELLAQIKESESTVSSYKAALEEAKSNYTSVEKTTNQQIQSCQDTVDTQNLSTNSEEVKKELEELKRKRNKVTVTAEQAGLITSINVSLGSIHNGGELMTIQDTSALKLKVAIKETDILNIKEGMHAVITTNANEKKEINGTVSKVVNFLTTSTAVSPEDGASASGYSAEILIEGSENLLLGMSAKAKIMLSEESKMMAVSYDSIIEEGEEHFVYKAVPADKDGFYEITRIPVEIIKDSNYYTAISSEELSLGDYIVCYPLEVSEGAVVEVDETYLTDEDGE